MKEHERLLIATKYHLKQIVSRMATAGNECAVSWQCGLRCIAPCRYNQRQVNGILLSGRISMRALRAPLLFLAAAIFSLILAASRLPAVAQQATPQPTSYGQTVIGQLDATHTEALYIFAAQAGDSIAVEMDR